MSKRNKHANLEIYTNAIYASLVIDRRSTTAHNPIQHDRTKQIEVDRHFIKEMLDNDLICTPYLST